VKFTTSLSAARLEKALDKLYYFYLFVQELATVPKK